MITHHLKTVQPYYERVREEEKTFDVRLNDRDFQAEDRAYLEEYDKETDTYSGRKTHVKITYVLNNFAGIKKNYCVFGFEVIEHLG